MADKDEPFEFMVYAHIYDVGHKTMTKGFNAVGRQLNTGVYHAGLELAGLEWAFAFAGDGMTGVYRSLPKQDPHHRYRETLEMGRVVMSQTDLANLIIPLQSEWQGRSYDVMRRNCCHFVSELLRRLGLDELPPWVTAMSKTGVSLEEGAQQVRRALDAARDFWRDLDDHLQLSSAMSDWGFCRQAHVAKHDKMRYHREESIYNIDVLLDTREDEMSTSSGSSGSSTRSGGEEVFMLAASQKIPSNWVWDESGLAL